MTAAGCGRRGFVEFYLAPALASEGIDVLAVPPDKRLDDKVKPEEASDVMAVAWVQGAAVGYHYPDLFRDVWEQNYEKRPEAEWVEMRAHGLALSERQGERPLEDAIRELAAEAAKWARLEAPGLLDGSEVAVLEQLARRGE